MRFNRNISILLQIRHQTNLQKLTWVYILYTTERDDISVGAELCDH
jgi:hypothetical protein